jgi:hypothetical protein
VKSRVDTKDVTFFQPSTAHEINSWTRYPMLLRLHYQYGWAVRPNIG